MLRSILIHTNKKKTKKRDQPIGNNIGSDYISVFKLINIRKIPIEKYKTKSKIKQSREVRKIWIIYCESLIFLLWRVRDFYN